MLRFEAWCTHKVFLCSDEIDCKFDILPFTAEPLTNTLEDLIFTLSQQHSWIFYYCEIAVIFKLFESTLTWINSNTNLQSIDLVLLTFLFQLSLIRSIISRQVIDYREIHQPLHHPSRPRIPLDYWHETATGSLPRGSSLAAESNSLVPRPATRHANFDRQRARHLPKSIASDKPVTLRCQPALLLSCHECRLCDYVCYGSAPPEYLVPGVIKLIYATRGTRLTR